MLPRKHFDKLIGKDLIFVVIDSNVHGVVVGRGQPAIVAAWVLETILNDSDTAGRVGSLLVESVALVRLDLVKVELARQGFVDELDTSNDIVVGRGSVLGLDLVQDGEGLGSTRVDRLPLGRCHALAGVVKAVLRAWDTVKVNQNLETISTSPCDGVVKVRRGAREIRGRGVVIGPEANRNADHVEARVVDLLCVGFGEPRVPVGSEGRAGIGVGDVLAESVFVNNTQRGVVLLENAWCNLWRYIFSDYPRYGT